MDQGSLSLALHDEQQKLGSKEHGRNTSGQILGVSIVLVGKPSKEKASASVPLIHCIVQPQMGIQRYPLDFNG